MGDNKKSDQGGRRENFSNRGHKLITPSTKPSQRPNPQPPKPDSK